MVNLGERVEIKLVYVQVTMIWRRREYSESTST